MIKIHCLIIPHWSMTNNLVIDVTVEFSLKMMQDCILTDGRISSLRKNPQWCIDKKLKMFNKFIVNTDKLNLKP